MRHKSLNSYAVETSTRTRRKSARRGTGITITPLRGFFLTLLFLGVPTVSLGTVCLSLIQNNLRLSEKNEELEAIASEVKAEVDSLGDEIETLQERAGVSKEEPQATSDEDSELTSSAKGAAKGSVWSDSIQRSSTQSGAQSSTQSVEGKPEIKELFANALLPRGGPSRAVDPVELLKDVQQQVPKLNQTLDVSVKPALEEALAEEAAYPDGTPMVGAVQVSSEFGLRSNPFGAGGYEMHEGIDFVGEYGDIVAATGDGVVTLVGPNGGYGNTVTIDHDYGYETLYAHLSEVKVKAGDTVKRGQIVGYVGSTGRSSGPHLHYSLYKDEKAINPRMLLKLPENNLAQGPR
ncbi:MAG: M23 family metallopeptidase [Cyanobacteria bacterium J06581_3]